MANLSDKKRALSSAAITLLACAVMAVVDGVISPPYAVKSAVKLVFFVALPLLYLSLSGDGVLRFILPRKDAGKSPAPVGAARACTAAAGAGVIVYAVIVGGFFALRGVVDFSAVTASLASGEGITRDNFIFVALYISFVNSFCEELLFRGLAFGVLREHAGRRTAYVFSSAAFALYHIAIMSGWFSPVTFALLIAALFLAGAVLDFFDERCGSVLPSYIVHIFANLGINTVGLILFGII